jgi:hypothetical protein
MNNKRERALAVRIVSTRRWQDDALSYSAALVALVALGISIWQGHLMAKQNRLTVRPLLFAFADFTRGPTKSGLILTNRGYGPAILNESFVYLDDQARRPMTRDGWTNVLRAGGMSVVAPTVTWDLEPGFVLETGSPIQLVRLADGDGDPEHLSALKQFVASNLRVEICYCSLHEECHRMTFRGDRTTVVPAVCSSPQAE